MVRIRGCVGASILTNPLNPGDWHETPRVLDATRGRRAQQGGKAYRVGFFSAGSAAPADFFLSDALRELGWIEGKNIIIERLYAENRMDRLPELAAELVYRNVDVIVAGGTLAPLALKRATTTIPIVMAAAGDPLGSGLVASFAHP